jgi:hypothetical protein
MGYTIEHHASPQPLKVYDGNEKQYAEIIVRAGDMERVERAKPGSPNRWVHFFGDLGFTPTEDGTLRCIFDDTDQRYVANDSWMDKLNREYATEAQIAEADRLGLVLQSREEDEVTGEVNLLFAVRE